MTRDDRFDVVRFRAEMQKDFDRPAWYSAREDFTRKRSDVPTFMDEVCRALPWLGAAFLVLSAASCGLLPYGVIQLFAG